MSKIVKSIKVKPVAATTRVVEEFFCDICSEEISVRRRVCTLCKRDCHGWQDKRGCSQTDDRDYGDYPDYYCSICYDLKFVKYNREYWDIQEELESKEEKLNKKILEESLAHESIIS